MEIMAKTVSVTFWDTLYVQVCHYNCKRIVHSQKYVTTNSSFKSCIKIIASFLSLHRKQITVL